MNPHCWLVSNSTIEGEYQGHKMRVFPAHCRNCEATTVFPSYATHWDKRHRESQTECLPIVAEQSQGSASMSTNGPTTDTKADDIISANNGTPKEATVNKGKKITSSKEYEKRRKEITEALTRTDGHVPSAAKELDIPESTLRSLVYRWRNENTVVIPLDTFNKETHLTAPQNGMTNPVLTVTPIDDSVLPRDVFTTTKPAESVVSELLKLAAEHEDAAKVLREAAKLVEA